MAAAGEAKFLTIGPKILKLGLPETSVTPPMPGGGRPRACPMRRGARRSHRGVLALRLPGRITAELTAAIGHQQGQLYASFGSKQDRFIGRWPAMRDLYGLRAARAQGTDSSGRRPSLLRDNAEALTRLDQPRDASPSLGARVLAARRQTLAGDRFLATPSRLSDQEQAWPTDSPAPSRTETSPPLRTCRPRCRDDLYRRSSRPSLPAGVRATSCEQSADIALAVFDHAIR